MFFHYFTKNDEHFLFRHFLNMSIILFTCSHGPLDSGFFLAYENISTDKIIYRKHFPSNLSRIIIINFVVHWCINIESLHGSQYFVFLNLIIYCTLLINSFNLRCLDILEDLQMDSQKLIWLLARYYWQPHHSSLR